MDLVDGIVAVAVLVGLVGIVVPVALRVSRALRYSGDARLVQADTVSAPRVEKARKLR